MNTCEICLQELASTEKLAKHLLSKHCLAPEGYFHVKKDKPLHRLEKSWWVESLPQKLRKDGFVYVVRQERLYGENVKLRRHLVHIEKIQQFYNRKLEEHEIAYHLDGKVSNNDIRNLAIFPFAEVASKRSHAASGKHSRRKGKRKEREVAKILQEWWGVGEFRPTPSSGGWDKGGDFNMKGDIVTTDDQFPFCVEIKNNEAWKFSTSLVSNKSALHKFWNQTEEEAKACGLIPLTVFTRNHHPLFAMVKDDVYGKLGLPFGVNMPIMDVHITLLDILMKQSREEIIHKTKI